jgi:RHS repeat-associated protein
MLPLLLLKHLKRTIMSATTDHKSATQPAAQHPLDRYVNQPQNGSSGKDESPYFKSAAPAISLPKGGGALKGIDEKLSVNAINGTAGLEVALPLTPGRNGFTPALSLSYNSGSGNSPFGLGWNLGLPSIRRRTDKQLPRYNDDADSDVFLLAGAEDLIPQLYEASPGSWQHDEAVKNVAIPSGTSTVTEACLVKRYRPRIEGLFARIEHIRSLTKGSWWRITTKDNITTWYGLTAAARISDPADDHRIFEWLPQLVVDGKGNVQHFIYKQENFDNVPADALFERNRNNGIAACTNLYLKNIRYCNLTPFTCSDPYAPALPSNAADFMMEAVLDYGEHTGTGTPEVPVYTPAVTWSYRPDAYSDYRAGFEIRTWRYCRRVLMFHRFAELGGGPVVVRSLDLDFSNTNNANAEAIFIASVTQTGYKQIDSTTWQKKSLPAMTMDYQPLKWNDALLSVAASDTVHAPQGLTGPYQWIDLWGEGLPGILTEQGDCWWYKSNLGNGHFSNALPVAEKPSIAGLAQGTLQLMDLDADGRKQAVVHEKGLEGFFTLNEDDQHWQAFRSFRETAKVNWNSPYTKLLDLDGDGRPDILVTEDRLWSWYKNKGTEGYEIGGQQSIGFDEEHGPRLVLNDRVQSIFLADMSGDGLTDLVRVRNGEVCYWPNLGYGKFGAKVSMSNAPVFDLPDQFNPLYLQLADISGTGASDLVYLGASSFRAWINLSGNAFSDAYDIAALPGIEPYSKVGVMDFLGNGTGCVVWSSPLPQHADHPMRYIDLMGGIKPYLMTAYHNGMGKTTSVAYKSSTQYYLEDKAAGMPWATKLPFPVQCISTITTTDAVSETSYTQCYSYHHGYYDYAEREFRGFGRVETIDTDAAAYYALAGTSNTGLHQAPVLTKTWYHNGAWVRERSLLDAFAEEYFQFDGWDELGTQAFFDLDLSDPDIAILEREAHRAMKGSALRQEVYALDGTADEDKPYTVTVSAYTVRVVQPRVEDNRYASFRTELQQSLSWSCERNPADARLAHSITLETDQWGNVLKSAQIAYPRRTAGSSVPAIVDDEQQKMHVVITCNSFTNDIGADPLSSAPESVAYRLRLPAEAQSYELYVPAAIYPSNNGLWTPVSLQAMIPAFSAALDFSAPLSGSSPLLRLLAHTRSFYASDATPGTALALGVLQSLALPHSHHTLALTQDTISDLYDAGSGSAVSNAMLATGGYVSTDSNTKWWIPSGTIQYSSTPAQDFYSPVSFTDPWANVTTIAYWPYNPTGSLSNYFLLPRKTTDAMGNTSTVDAYDWRVLQPTQITDLNDNISQITYDALGMPVAMALMGKGTEGDYLQELSSATDLIADTTSDTAMQSAFWSATTASILEQKAAELLGKATWRCIYDWGTAPARVAMIAREQHYTVDSNSPTIVRITYTDGLGRVIMHKARAADDATGAARWIGSGRTVYNNKGKAVLQYEPYFSTAHECDTALQAAASGVSPKMFYDPLGRLCRTEMPDGTFSYTVWDNWSQTVYDAGDTLLQSDWYAQRTGSGPLASITEEADAAAKSAHYAATPAVMHLDTLARPFYTIQHNRTPDYATTPMSYVDQYIHSYEVLDITGNRLAVHDGTGKIQLSYRYSMLKVPGYQVSVDGGAGMMLTDVAGQPLYHWDADGREFFTDYDALRRPLEQWCDTTILSKTNYGEGLSGDKTYNLRGQVVAGYDGSGKHHVDAYNFKGQPVTSYMQLLQDATIADADWNALSDADLVSNEVFFTAIISDALGRPVTSDTGRIITTTSGTSTEHNSSSYTYEKDGALKTVSMGSDVYVQDIHHNAKGQREAIWYGNGTKTSYTYDDLSHRLTRILTVNVNTASSHYNEQLQDLNYYYDASGNISLIRDDAQETVFFKNTIVTPEADYTYDALYRLVQGKGRESINNPSFTNDNTSDTHAFVNNILKWDGSSVALRHYTQRYSYDEAGNILELQHIAGTGSYTRSYSYATGSNRLSQTQISGTYFSYHYDARGNINGMPHLAYMDYDMLSQMSYVTDGTVQTYYQYSSGQRARKFLDKTATSSVTEERIYYGSYEVYRKWSGSMLSLERTTLHVSDNAGRIAMIEKRTQGTDASPALLKRFIYANHLGSAALELDDTGAVISYEEYHPFGTTAYQAMNSSINAVAKRYRYTGKERDEESGLNYHGARYYAPWLCRWCAVDPLEGKYAGWSAYNYCFNSPINKTDSTGEGPDDIPTNGKPVLLKSQNASALQFDPHESPSTPPSAPHVDVIYTNTEGCSLGTQQHKRKAPTHTQHHTPAAKPKAIDSRTAELRAIYQKTILPILMPFIKQGIISQEIGFMLFMKIVESYMHLAPANGSNPNVGQKTGYSEFTIGSANDGKHTHQYVLYNGKELKTGLIPYRFNNPGDLRPYKGKPQQGGIGVSNNTKSGLFSVFPDASTGFEATARLLRTSKNYKGKTLSEVIYKYAPPSENNTEKYISDLSASAGISRETIVSDLPDEKLQVVLKGIAGIEGFYRTDKGSDNHTYFAGQPNNPAWVDKIFQQYATSK